MNLGRFDDLQLGVKGIVIPAWLAERDAETFCFGCSTRAYLTTSLRSPGADGTKRFTPNGAPVSARVAAMA